MSATLRYPHRDIKLLSINDRKNQCSYSLHYFLKRGPSRLIDIVRKFKPDIKIPEDPLYHQVRRHVIALRDLGYVTLERRDLIDWTRTEKDRCREIQNSVQNIFAAAVQDTPPFISTGTHREGPGSNISYAKRADPSLYVVPTVQYVYLLSRMQNSNHFLENAKGRTELGQLRADLLEKKMLKGPVKSCKCPYRISGRTRGTRLDAVFQLRRINQHRKFKRRDPRFVNPELVRDLDYVQGKFDSYKEDIQDLKCALIHKENGSIKLIDYQTRFTDETRKDGVISRFYRTVEKATEFYNSGVFLTLTSYPPSEGSRLQHRSSLWHVNRYFGRSWNAYLSKLQKRKRAARRDELLKVMRSRVVQVRSCVLDRNGEVKLTREERTEALRPMKGENFRPKYLMIYEFQKNGMIHGHCVIFGSQWLDNYERIKEDWRLTGQGERIHVYGIKNEGTGWTWSKGSPQDSRNRQPIDYLMKYLGKGVRVSAGHGMYWAVNKRFFSSSQALTQDQDLPIEKEKMPVFYEFLGTLKGDEIPSWLIRSPRVPGSRAGGYLDPFGHIMQGEPA